MLTRLDQAKFGSLRDEWGTQCEDFGECLSDYAAPALDHAQSIVHEEPQDKNYGIYTYEADGSYGCIVHINCAKLPGTSGKTLRLVWTLLAPKYDYGEVSANDLAEISSGIIVGAVMIARTDMAANHIKIHLGNFVDKDFFTTIATALVAAKLFREQAIKGNWLHITM